MDVFGGALRCHSPEGKGREGPKCETRAACRGRGNGARGSPGGGGRAAELARTNESRKEEAKSFSVKRPKPTERRRRSLAEAKRSELCSPRRSAALRPRPSGRRPGSRCGDGTRCSPVRPSENGRTLMCVTEAAHAACARRAPCSGPAVQPRSSVCRARRPGSGRLHSPHCRCRFRGKLRPPRSLAGRALRAARAGLFADTADPRLRLFAFPGEAPGTNIWFVGCAPLKRGVP